MNLRTICGAVLLMSVALAASAQQSAEPSELRKGTPICIPGGDCSKHKHLLTYPAHALSYAHGTFVLHQRGVNWMGNIGAMSLTVRRPPDYAGGKVRLTLFHEVLSDDDGNIVFHVTPMTFNHGNSFETYGSVAVEY